MNYKRNKQLMNASFLRTCVLAMVLTITFQNYGIAQIPKENDRIGWSADGNNNDPDDWGATPIALAIWAKMGWQDKLVHFDYNSRLDDNKDWKYKENNESTLGAARKFRFDISKFFDDQNQLDEAVANLAKEINASSEDSRLWICVAGPFEVVYRGIQAADSSKRKYCTLVSHSPMNEKAGKWKLEDGSPSPGKDDCVALGVQYLKIKTGNGCGDAFGGGTCQKWEEVEWLKNSPDPRYNWIWDRLEATRLESAKQTSKPNGKLDASDCTMAYYLAYNDENGNFIKLHEKLGNRLRHDNYGNPDKLDVIIIEAESVSPSGGWISETKHEGYCGNGYLFYTGPNLMKENLANSSLVYKFKIKKEGKYNIWWRGRRDYGENCPDDAKGDACNDIWASLDGSELSKKLVKPPFGEWGWGTPATDYVPFSEHLSVGEHVLKIGGRSHGVKLDQIVILPESMGKPVTNDCLSDGGTGNTAAYPECIKIMSVDFEDITAGEAAYFINANHNCLAINAGNVNNRDKWAAAAQPFTGKTGIYNIVLHGLLEWDGESPYRVSVNGKVVGEATNRTAIRSENYDTQKHAFNNIVIKTNDVIKVESMAVTNGKVPEKGGTAYARGRWRTIEFIKIEK